MIIIATSGHRPDDERIYQREIVSLLKAGYKITYFTRWNGTLDMTGENLKHINYQNASLLSFSNRIKSIARSLAPEVLHIHEFELLPLGKWFRKEFKVPVIYDVHDTLRAMWETFSSLKGVSKRAVNWGLSVFENKYLKYVDKILLANPVLDENYYAEKGISTTVIENYPQEALPAPFHPPDSPSIILYQGQLSEDRGILILLKAFQKVRAHHPDVRLVLIGPARYKKFSVQLEQFVTENNLSENIKIFPEISSTEVWNYMQRAAIGVIPSKNTPRTRLDTPTKLFEYMAAGCAVVASDLPPIRYHSADAFVLVEPDQADKLAAGIISLLEDQEQLREKIALSRKLIERKFNWERVEPRFLEVYQKLLS